MGKKNSRQSTFRFIAPLKRVLFSEFQRNFLDALELCAEPPDLAGTVCTVLRRLKPSRYLSELLLKAVSNI